MADALGISSHAAVHGLIGKLVGKLVSSTQGVLNLEVIQLADATLRFFPEGAQIGAVDLVSALHLTDHQLGVGDDAKAAVAVFQGPGKDGKQGGVFGEVVGAFAEVFAEAREDASVGILEDRSEACGAGIAAGTAVAVGDEERGSRVVGVGKRRSGSVRSRHEVQCKTRERRAGNAYEFEAEASIQRQCPLLRSCSEWDFGMGMRAGFQSGFQSGFAKGELESMSSEAFPLGAGAWVQFPKQQSVQSTQMEIKLSGGKSELTRIRGISGRGLEATPEALRARATEMDLIREAQAGSRTAFDALVRQYEHQVLRLALHLTGSEQDAEDIYQEAFLKAFRYLGNFRFECSFYTWIYRIVTNLCLDQLRRRKTRREDSMVVTDHQGEEMDLMASISDDRSYSNPDRELNRKVLGERISEALETLTPRERTVFELKHYQGLRLRTIGEMLNTTEETAKNTLFRATKKLRSQLAGIR